MLRIGTSVSCALVLAGLLLWALPAAANQTIGAACTGSGGDSAQSGDGNNTYCNGSTIQYPAYQFGSTSNSCNSTNAGRVQYTSGGVLEACNGTSWIPIDSGMHFISTQTASASASLQFTGLGTYKIYHLVCSGLVMNSSANGPRIQIGEGATPTWETSGYTIIDYYGSVARLRLQERAAVRAELLEPQGRLGRARAAQSLPEGVSG